MPLEIFGGLVLFCVFVLTPLAAWRRWLWPRTFWRRTACVLSVLLWLQLTAGFLLA